ncbi:MAG: MFS transporter [Aigarchaeota archaeon]|nr:MFS transporter [Aigarchaeota archaeon]MDW8092880.1 MFS transporter [Nitrososphaerota archaeon]
MRDYHLIWTAFLTTWVCAYAARTLFSPAIPPIMRDLSLSYTLIGLASSAIFYTYALTQFAAGFIGSRFGRKRALIFGMGVSGIATTLTSIANDLISLITFRTMTGLGQGFLFSNDRSIIAHVTPKEKLGFAQGLSFSGVGIGLLLGVFGGGLLIGVLGWRVTFLLVASLSLISLFLLTTMVKEPPREDWNALNIKSAVKGLMVDREYIALILAGVPIHYNYWVLTTWLPTALIESKIGDVFTSTAITSLIGIAAPVGLVTLGKLSDIAFMKGRGEWIIVGALSASLVIMTLLLTVEYVMRAHVALIFVTTFLTGLAIWGTWAPMYRIAARVRSGSLSAIAFGIMNGFHFIGAIVSPFITGYIRDLTGDFTSGFVIAALFPLLCVVLGFTVKFKSS